MKQRFITAAEKATEKAESHRKAVASIGTESEIELTDEQKYIQDWMEETAEKRAEYIRDAFNLALMGNDEYPA